MRIQKAALPSSNFFGDNFSAYFICYKPLMGVSGDFYWAKKYKHYLLFAVADCTGHGIPGAFVSMLGISFLNEIYYKNEIHTAAEILEILRIRIKESLNYNSNDSNLEGMDIAFCIINTQNLELQFAGANNPLYLISKTNPQNIEIIEADKQPIGKHFRERPFTNHTRQVQIGDKLYLFSDGYRDQFDATGYEKFKSHRFKKLLLQNASKSMSIQKERIETNFREWKKNWSQIDDITVLGVEI